MKHKSPRKILLVADDCGAGDILRIHFCLCSFRRAYPDAEIVLLVDRRAYDVVANDRAFDRVIASDIYAGKSFVDRGSTRNKLACALRAAFALGFGYDLAVIFEAGTAVLHIITSLIAKTRIGYAREYPKLLSVDLGRFQQTLDPVAQNTEILNLLGIPWQRETAAPAQSVANEEEAHRILADAGLDDPRGFAVLHPGSDWACQQWRCELWSQLADALIERYGLDVAFTGTQSERGLIDEIRSGMMHASSSLAGKTSLLVLSAVLQRAVLCVSIDTVVFELSQVAGISAVILAGPSSPHFSLHGRVPPIIINRMDDDLRQAINKCRAPKFTGPGCLNYDCSMHGLNQIEVTDVLASIDACGVLVTKRSRTPE